MRGNWVPICIRQCDCRIFPKVGSNQLRQLSERLFVAILSCVVTAVLQFTVGLVNYPWASLTCVWGAVLSVILLLQCLLSIRSNLGIMFRHLEDVAANSADDAETAEEHSQGK